jgi:hypothetical protein
MLSKRTHYLFVPHPSSRNKHDEQRIMDHENGPNAMDPGRVLAVGDALRM